MKSIFVVLAIFVSGSCFAMNCSVQAPWGSQITAQVPNPLKLGNYAILMGNIGNPLLISCGKYTDGKGKPVSGQFELIEIAPNSCQMASVSYLENQALNDGSILVATEKHFVFGCQ